MRLLRRLMLRLRPPSFEQVERSERLFYQSHVRGGMTVFDVGANVGELSLLFSRLAGSGRVHAFEPGPAAFAALQSAVAAQGAANVTANRLALSDAAGEASLYCYDGPLHVFSSMAERPLAAYGVEAGPARRETVPATTLDAYCEAHGVTGIDLLKIDVEGAEYQVLKGARDMLRDKRIGCIVFEFGQATFDMGNRPGEIAALFRDHDYRLANLIEDAPLFPGGRNVRSARFAMHVARPS